MSGLEEVGVPGPDHLREALTNCTDPLAAIEEFQARTTIISYPPPCISTPDISSISYCHRDTWRNYGSLTLILTLTTWVCQELLIVRLLRGVISDNRCGHCVHAIFVSMWAEGNESACWVVSWVATLAMWSDVNCHLQSPSNCLCWHC